MSNSIVLKNARIIDPSRHLDEIGTIIVEDGVIVAAGKDADGRPVPTGAVVRDCSGLVAAAGGITSFIMMPDTHPVIDDIALVEFVKKTARDTAVVNVYPAAALTKGMAGEEMSEIGLLKQAGAVAFTDGHAGIN